MAKFIKCYVGNSYAIVDVERIVRVYKNERNNKTTILLDCHIAGDNPYSREFVEVEETPDEIFEKLNRLGYC